jgi:hypothetical protein
MRLNKEAAHGRSGPVMLHWNSCAEQGASADGETDRATSDLPGQLGKSSIQFFSS